MEWYLYISDVKYRNGIVRFNAKSLLSSIETRSKFQTHITKFMLPKYDNKCGRVGSRGYQGAVGYKNMKLRESSIFTGSPLISYGRVWG